jgi:hypothetical protein
MKRNSKYVKITAISIITVIIIPISFSHQIIVHDWKMCSLANTDIPKAFFAPHHTCHCCTNVIQGNCYATVWSTSILDHSCTCVATGIAAARAWPDQVTKARDRWPAGLSPRKQQPLEARRQHTSWENHGPQGLNNAGLESVMGALSMRAYFPKVA